ncbi:hypothetical protein NDU88_004600 [Pleurodeles waltl]|uniref:Uncharacterized protein n=1 Tax=Pleurodeles waltl TaxID=8319 RepID=A0AAV7PCZ7_PLEWA|nr:hypothetical protein NDU88_004600 [Pleurodeles waltl]
MVMDVKDIKKDMGELGQVVITHEQASDSCKKELDGHRRELLDLRDKNDELRYQLEELKNRSLRANIRIKVLPLQANVGSLED